jgi:hypothetical protein
MRVLVACEFSGRVRDAFLANGHDAISCDLIPTEVPGPHYLGDLLDDRWDLMVAFPPCTHLAVSGARWFAEKLRGGPHPTLDLGILESPRTQAEAVAFVEDLLAAPIPRIALENPVSVLSSRIRRPDQIVQPWEHGHPVTKQTCLWLKDLPPLVPTAIVPNPARLAIRDLPPSSHRSRDRSRTFAGIARAMADQWGSL